jgi:hypothetical protein
MINPKELRIGNILQKSTNELLIVGEITDNGFGCKVVDRDKFSLPTGWEIHPIPITEDWLLNFGFEQNGHKLPIQLHQRGKTHIKYVHQLQNLYFALTGEELTWIF